MTDSLLAISLLWIFVFIYAVAATIDFGAGFWSMIYLGKRQMRATRIANKYLSPSWEVTNVFIVLIVVALVSFFPGATYTLGTVMLIPGSLVILLLALRSAFLVFSHTAKEYEKFLTYVSGISGFLIPGLLILILPISHGGYIKTTGGIESLSFVALLENWSTYAFFGFAISSTLFLSSLLLSDYSNVAGDDEAFIIYRRDAQILGPIVLLFALLIMLAIKVEANWLYENMMNQLAWLVASIVVFALSYGVLWIKKRIPRIAVIGIVIQYLLASYAYGVSHLPYIVYPIVTIESGFTDPNMFRALFVSYIVGFAILIPGFIYFWRLFMKDRRYIKSGDS
ncbi:cytochrome d ubiquinol oxidase subunit II [Pseudalkalibacillus berkeleyi]|uniref:Cytochrome d ubiquinol oxidase subunit II n=1 Tax=Pseudalkalibacillus berkeleyi TaxID=1069813 RepID=A0ABS9GXN4_9BACL|nr:cytochrome d ubiquinol oxidase subunit II [Pseudalkalibacillus berkeleyi]MCF6137533.1 cytochrome d ubiquinol oxidase subunit II [Pseudalkalibacillus berkeleyi]